MTGHRFLEPQTQHYIGGKFCGSALGATFDTIHPASGEILSQVAAGTGEDVDRAVTVAQQAYEVWSVTDPKERAVVLHKIADLIEHYRQQLAVLESLDTGKPWSETFNGDIPRAAANFRYFANLLTQERAQEFVSDDGSTHRAYREPLGVCGLITPWNLPLYLATWKIAPALAMGNAVVLKPAELTPLSANALAEICEEAGLPPGVYNVVHGFGPGAAGEALVKHEQVASISFTGETATGRAIMAAAAPSLKKISFELGGKGASVVFADADLSQAVPTVCRAAFRNQGQICLAGSRLLLQKNIADRFLQDLNGLTQQIRLGDPLAKETTMGSLISIEHRDRVAHYVELGQQEGAKLLTGGSIPADLPAAGAFYEPTILTGLAQSSRLIQEEIFGPVLTVQTFTDRQDAVEKLNGTPYGLSCSVWSKSPETLAYVSHKARCGLVWQNSWFLRNLNTPFGGMKASGVGREGGYASFNFFSEQKTISQPKEL